MVALTWSSFGAEPKSISTSPPSVSFPDSSFGSSAAILFSCYPRLEVSQPIDFATDGSKVMHALHINAAAAKRLQTTPSSEEMSSSMSNLAKSLALTQVAIGNSLKSQIVQRIASCGATFLDCIHLSRHIVQISINRYHCRRLTTRAARTRRSLIFSQPLRFPQVLTAL